MIFLIRAIFLVLVSIVALAYSQAAVNNALSQNDAVTYYIMIGGVVAAFVVFLLDIVFKKKNLTTLSGVLFGILVGVVISVFIGYLVDEVASVFLLQPVPEITSAAATMRPANLVAPAFPSDTVTAPAPEKSATAAATQPANRVAAWLAVQARDAVIQYNDMLLKVLQGLKLLIGLMVVYISVSFILQTKDDFRFIIPYVEFSRATRGPRPMIVDTSIIIDGRVVELAATGVFESPLLVPRFVLNELQTIADSGDRLKRSRGRRGLEVLEKLKAMPRLELRFWDGTLTNSPETDGVDQKLVVLAQQENGRIMTNDFNLNKIASLRGITVINVNSIADALKPVVLPGETMKVRVVKPGEGQMQGVGYLEDGTMVVVEGARDKVGTEVELVVTNALQTAAGKMIFGRTDGAGHIPAHSPMAGRAPKV